MRGLRRLGRVTKPRARFLLPLIYLGYISLGLPDGAFGVAWPRIYPELNLPLGLAGTVLTMGTIFAAISGFSSGWLMARWPTGPVVLGSGVLTASGLLIIAHAHGAAWLYAAAVPLGFGAGAVDACLNGFVARHYSGRHMNWLHACWGMGATLGPLLMGLALAGAVGWRGGYVALGSVQAALAIVLVLTLSLWASAPERPLDGDGTERAATTPTRGANSFEGFLSAAIFALYVGAEATAGVWAATVLVVERGVSKPVAGVCAACFYGAIMLGRVLTGVVVERTGNRRMVRWGVLLALAGAVLFVFGRSVWLDAAALMLLGLGFAPVYPCLMHEVPARFAPEAVQTMIGRQSGAGAIGYAVLPAAAGAIAQWRLDVVPWLVVAGTVALLAAIRELDRRS